MARGDPEPLDAGSDRWGSPVTGEYMSLTRTLTRTTNPSLSRRRQSLRGSETPCNSKGFEQRRITPKSVRAVQLASLGLEVSFATQVVFSRLSTGGDSTFDKAADPP